MYAGSGRYIVAGLVLLVGAGGAEVAYRLRGTESKYEVDFSVVPMTIGEYTGRKLPLDESIYRYLGAEGMDERVYESPDRDIYLSLVYGTDWRSIHAPTGCYPAQGWLIVHSRTIELPAPPDCPHPGPLHARVLEVMKGDVVRLAMFVYARPGATTSDWTTHAFKVATGQRGAGGMIISLSTDSRSGAKQAEQALGELLAAFYAPVVGFWYGGGK